MPSKLKLRLNRASTLLAVAFVCALAYMFMPSCSILADADDTLCHAIAAARGGVVDWPDDEYLQDPQRWHKDPSGACHHFDSIMMNPWVQSEDARAYIEGFGLVQGHNWGDLGRPDPATFNPKTESLEIDTPMGRTYNGYSNIVFANLEGIELNRGRALNDFEHYDTFLKWASAFVSQRTYRVNGNCYRSCQTVDGYRCVIAKTVSGAFRNDYIDLFQTFFYEIDSIWRASTIVHEVRHARDQVAHNGGTGCPHGSACDIRWSTAGANTYELLWLTAYYWTPVDHPFITPARRARAAALFNSRHFEMFNEHVQWELGDFRQINEIPEFYVEQVACSEDPNHPHHCLVLAH